MNCPACGIENPPGKKFCGDCGAKLSDAAPPARASESTRIFKIPDALQATPPEGAALPRTKDAPPRPEAPPGASAKSAASAPPAKPADTAPPKAAAPAPRQKKPAPASIRASGAAQSTATTKPAPRNVANAPAAPEAATDTTQALDSAQIRKMLESVEPPRPDKLERARPGSGAFKLKGLPQDPRAQKGEIGTPESTATKRDSAADAPPGKKGETPAQGAPGSAPASVASATAGSLAEDLEALASGFEPPGGPAASTPGTAPTAPAPSAPSARAGETQPKLQVPAAPAGESVTELESLADGFEAAAPAHTSDLADDLEALAAGFETNSATSKVADLSEDLEALADGFEPKAAGPGTATPFDDLEALAEGFEAPPAASAPEPVDDLEALAAGFESVPAATTPGGVTEDLEALAAGFEAGPPRSTVSDLSDDLDALGAGLESKAPDVPAQNLSEDLEALADQFDAPDAAAPASTVEDLEALADGFDAPAKTGPAADTAFDDLESLAADFDSPAVAPAVDDLEALAADLDRAAHAPAPAAEELDALADGFEQDFSDWQDAETGEAPATDEAPGPAPAAPPSGLGDWSDLESLASEFSELAPADAAGPVDLESMPMPEDLSDAGEALPSTEAAVSAGSASSASSAAGSEPASDAAAEWDEDDDRVLLVDTAGMLSNATPSARNAQTDALDELASAFEGEDVWDAGPAPTTDAAYDGDQPTASGEPAGTTTHGESAETDASEVELEDGAELLGVGSESHSEADRHESDLSGADLAESDLLDEPEPEAPPAQTMSQLISAEAAAFMDEFSDALGTGPATSDAPALDDESGYAVEAEPGIEVESHEPPPEEALAVEPEALESDSDGSESEPAAETVEEEAAVAPAAAPVVGALAALFAPIKATSSTDPGPPPADPESQVAEDGSLQEEAFGEGDIPSESGLDEGYGPDAVADEGTVEADEALADQAGADDADALEPLDEIADASAPSPPAAASPPPPSTGKPVVAAGAAPPAAGRASEAVEAWDAAVADFEQEAPAGVVADAAHPETVLVPSESMGPVPPKPVKRRVRAAGVLGKLFILLVLAGLGVGGYFAYSRWGESLLHRFFPEAGKNVELAPLVVADEPVTEGSLRRAIASNPSDRSAYEKLADFLEKQGKKDEADFYRTHAPAAAVAASTPAPKATARPEESAATIATTAGTPAGPTSPPATQPPSADDAVSALLEEGKALERDGKTSEALERYRKVLQINPKNHDALLLTGGAQRALGQIDSAYETLKQLLHLHPKSAVGYNELGFVERLQATNQDGILKAIADFQHAIELDPNLTAAYTNLGAAYEAVGDATNAMETRKKAVELSPDDAEAHAQLGLSYLAADHADDAKLELEKAISLNPNEGVYHSNLGYWFVVQGRTEEALPHYQKAIELEPKNPVNHSELGSAYLLLKRYDDAKAAFKIAHDLDPASAVHLSNLAFTEKAQGNLEASLTLFEQAAAAAPEDSQIQLGLAGTLDALGRTRQAILAYKRAVQYDNCNYVASYNLATLYQKDIRYKDKAIEEWNRYLSMVERCAIEGQAEFVRQAKRNLKELDY